MKKGLIYIILFFLFASCEQYFIPDIESEDHYLVFEGSISTEAKAYTLKVSVSSPFDQKTYFRKIAGIEAWIEDANGDKFPYHFVDTGIFITDTNVKAEIGHAYRLVAIDSAGNEYSSDYDTVYPVGEITNIYGEPYAEYYLANYGDLGDKINITTGVQVYLNTNLTGNKCYYRYEYDLVFQTIQIYPTDPFPTSYYILTPWSSVNSDFIRTVSGVNYSGNLVTGVELDFIPRYLMNNEVDIPEAPPTDYTYYMNGFFIRIKQHSISEHTYQFWKSINEQLNALGQLLDPVQSQINGNIQCTSNEEIKVYGNFEASSVSSKTKFLLPEKVAGEYIIRSADTEYFPEIDSVTFQRDVYPFWIIL